MEINTVTAFFCVFQLPQICMVNFIAVFSANQSRQDWHNGTTRDSFCPHDQGLNRTMGSEKVLFNIIITQYT